MDTQLDFLEDFAAAERRRKARHDLIDQVNADRRVKALLHMLADYPQSVADERGNSHVTAAVRKMASRLDCSRNTIRAYIDLACQTPYLEILDATVDHDERTYVIRWHSIVNRETNPTNEQAANCTARQPSMQAANCTATEDARGSIRRPGGGQSQPPRGSIPAPEGVNSEAGGGQFDRVNSPHTPSENLLSLNQIHTTLLLPSAPSKPSSNQRATERAPRHQRSRTRHQVRQSSRRIDWPLWERAILARDLANPEHVRELVAIAVELGAVDDTEEHCYEVFCQAAKQVRMCRTGEARTRTGLFASNVAANRWQCDKADRETADLMIRRAYLHGSPEAQAARRQIVEAARAVRGVPTDALDDRQSLDAKKDLARLRILEKYPELFQQHPPLKGIND